MSFEVGSKSLENEQLDTASLKSQIGKEADASGSRSASRSYARQDPDPLSLLFH